MPKVVICGVNTSTLPKLSREKGEQLLREALRGNGEAREQFIIANMRLVLSIIKRFKLKTNCSDDVFQAGMIGLIKAIDNFNFSFNVKFSTYAVPMIVGEIKRFLRDGNSLKIARSIRDTAYLALKTRGEMEKDGNEVSMESVAKQMNVAYLEVVYALDAISDTVSLYDTVYNKNGDELMLIDQIGDDKNTDEAWTENVALLDALEKLSEREKKIIKMRYFEGRTQTEISTAVGISQAQVSRLEKNALLSIKSGL